MSLFTIDFETYWDKDYTLSKMTTEAYVRDPRFAIHMCGIKRDNGPRMALSPSQWTTLLAAGLRKELRQSAILCQNTAFDGLILSHHYQIEPVMWLDTMSMFRAVHPDKRASLKVIAETLGLGKKGGEGGYSVVNTRGKRALTAQEYEALAYYCALADDSDVELAYSAFQILKENFSLFELRLIDQTIRFMTNPILHLNPAPLIAEVEAEKERKAELLERIGHDKKVLASNEKFAALLQAFGIEPPIKISPTQVKKAPDHVRFALDTMQMQDLDMTPANCEEMGLKWTWAFGKNDPGMAALSQHDDPIVVAAVEARLGVKSTIKETRAARLLDASARGAFPISLAYCAAHTSRWGGSGGVNVQNLSRGSRLRDAFVAPPGYSLVVCDLSAIEARVLPYLAGQDDAVEVFAQGGDIYCDMASAVYQRPITKQDKAERQVGKVLILSSGYGMGWRKFATNMYLTNKTLFDTVMLDTLGRSTGYVFNKHGSWLKASKPLTLTMEQWAIHCAVSEYLSSVYRSKNDKIVAWWAYLDRVLQTMARGGNCEADHKGVVKAVGNTFVAPVGNPIRYIDLQMERTPTGCTKITKASKEGRSHLHGGVAAENITQWVSRHIMAEQALKLQTMGLHIAFTCHDEIVGVCRDAKAEYWKSTMEAVMSETPTWAPGLPLAAEAAIGKSYGEAK